MKECTGETKEKEGEFDEMANSSGVAQKDFIFIRLPVLREVSAMCVCMYMYVCMCVLYKYYLVCELCIFIEHARFHIAVFGARASH